ncbi:sugar ABC transporter substrate-binding protein [Paenibacillus marchantiophytorum]|uniref:Sugar ABC transporter substrate-binding protein n=1 Tax=Paenibacillus marchantiophytorum TaxID=1619310 RepID=A0ABQ1FI23_9BACL|nr:sugar ABC transporter substrate-binding protein [Paenibacillus marchantiophytorum]GGA11833.1 sugar ABC transporter substrate-binding protein [Paenibacillus marchantiophytorum]
MKKSKLTVGSFAFMLLVSSVLTACSDTKGANNEGGDSKNVTITQFVPDLPDKTFVEKLVPDFEAAHPNIKVKIMKAPYSEFDSKLQSLVAAGTAPDVTSHWGEMGFAEFIDKGMLRDMSDLIKADNFKATDHGMTDDVMNIYKVDGKNYGIPVYSYTSLMLYNKDMFDKAGLPYPPADFEDKSWTFDKMMEVAKKLSKPSDDPQKTEFGIDWGWAEKDMRLIYFGAKVYSDDTWTNGGHPTASYFNSPEAIKANQRIHDMIYKDKVMPSKEFTKAVAGQGGDPFATGKVGMSVAGAWILASVKDYSFKVGVAAVPVGYNDKARDVLYIDPLVILKDSKHPKEAYEWIKYQLQKDVQEKAIELSGGTPPSNQQAAEKYFNLYAPAIDPKDLKKVVEGGLKHGTESYNHLISSYSHILDVVNNEMDQLDNEKANAAAINAVMDKKVNELLTELNTKYKKN